MTPEHGCITWEKAKAKLPKGKENEMGAKCPCEDKCDGDCIFLEEKEDEEVEEDIEDISNDSHKGLNIGA
jgi:hypothetical protein